MTDSIRYTTREWGLMIKSGIDHATAKAPKEPRETPVY